MSTIDARSDRRACLARLRRRISAIERGSFGARPMERSLYRPERNGQDLFEENLANPALQELVAADYGSRPAVRDFSLALVASLLHRQAGAEGMVLWCQRQRDETEFGRLYGPGLKGLGLPPDRLIMVTGKRDADCLWAMEQGLSSRSLVAVIGAVDRVDLIASRRLALAAAAHRTCCLLLPSQHGLEPSAARLRWRVEAAASRPDVLDPKGLGLPSWQLTLERNRNGRTGHWIVEWDHAAHRFHLPAALGNRPVARVARRDGPNKEDPSVVVFGRTG